jgi:hypothetical protein
MVTGRWLASPGHVLPPIVVDLGPYVAAAELRYVLDACNEVVAEGACLPQGEQGDVEPRALAVARTEDRAARVVEIEVRLMHSEQPLVRTLRFTREDPARERWRSVGLAIATLVGEGQRAQEAEQAAREAEAPTRSAPPPSAPPPSAPPPPAPPPTPVLEDARAEVEPLAGVFIGVGVFGGPALADGSGRVGASLRGGWASSSGLMLLGSAGYSVRAVSGDPFTVSWLSVEAGAGYRFWLGDELSAGVSLQLGLQQLRFAASARGLERSTAVYNPLATLGVDGWWLPWARFGFWVALDAHSIGRKSELFVADTLTVSTLPVDVTGLFGVGWRIH